ncbi:MAG: TrkH family potassium uptake protein [Treponema sp.]|nr:TrkH family potassium uptake protein [Treponema sp.]
MKRRILIKVLALLLGLIALSMIPSLFLAIADRHEQSIRAFLYPILVCTSGALLALLLGKSSQVFLNAGDGFLLVSLAWFLTSILGSIPFIVTGVVSNPVDALFESVSGFTTTGATIFADVETLPRAILFWRAMTHWLGGMGIVVLTVALIPLLGVGGFQLLKAEAPGPEKDKITPKITATAKILWFIYIGLTALEVLLLMIGGMNWFDAVTHAFATMATGGFGTKNASIAYYNSAWIDWVITIFMILAGMNFSLYYRALQGKFQDIIKNTELKVYLAIILIASLLIALTLLPKYNTMAEALRFSSFQVASILTTTGFATADFDLWPSFAKAVLLVLMFIGGCSGSTGGGIKVVRHVVLFKQAGNEIRRLLHPRGVFSIQLNGRVGRKDVVYGVAGFVFLYLALVFAVTMVVTISGADLVSALSTALVTVGNIGPGFGIVGPSQNYAHYPDYVKLVCSFAMVAGRLELWTVFILFTPEFWRR